MFAKMERKPVVYTGGKNDAAEIVKWVRATLSKASNFQHAATQAAFSQ